MSNMTLEHEFELRKNMHMICMLGAYYMKEYLDEQTKGVSIPKFMLMDKADEVSNNKVQSAMLNGTFKEEYYNAWESMKDKLPDNLNSLIPHNS